MTDGRRDGERRVGWGGGDLEGREREGETDEWEREREFCIFTCLVNIWTLPLHPSVIGLFLDVAGFFVCSVLIEYVAYSLLIEHVLRFEPHVGCSKRDSARYKYIYYH